MKLESKYNEEDLLYTMEKDKVVSGKVCAITITTRGGKVTDMYWIRTTNGTELYRQPSQLFTSKEELLKSL